MNRQYKTTDAQRRASKAYRERMKQFDPQAYKAKVKEYNDKAKEKRQEREDDYDEIVRETELELQQLDAYYGTTAYTQGVPDWDMYPDDFDYTLDLE